MANTPDGALSMQRTPMIGEARTGVFVSLN